MAYSVNWLTKIITIPQSDLVWISGDIYKLDLELCHQELRRLEWVFDEGMTRDQILKYIPPLEAGGVIYARFVLLINGYTVTFEDGQYAVNFDGANTNIHDYTNVNQVSVRPNNSAGLQDLSTLLSSAYNGEVAINVVTGQAGTATPIGTLGKPSNNWTDAGTIHDTINGKNFLLQGSLTLVAGDNAEHKTIIGTNPLTSILTVESAADTLGMITKDLTFSGDLDGGAILEHCVLGDINYFNGYINDCALSSATIKVNGTGVFISCRAGATCVTAPILDLIDTVGLAVRDYDGNLKIINKQNISTCQITINGELEIDSTCNAGAIKVYGDGYVIDNSSGTFELIDYTTGSPQEIAAAVWAKELP